MALSVPCHVYRDYSQNLRIYIYPRGGQEQWFKEGNDGTQTDMQDKKERGTG